MDSCPFKRVKLEGNTRWPRLRRVGTRTAKQRYWILPAIFPVCEGGERAGRISATEYQDIGLVHGGEAPGVGLFMAGGEGGGVPLSFRSDCELVLTGPCTQLFVRFIIARRMERSTAPLRRRLQLHSLHIGSSPRLHLPLPRVWPHL